MFIAISFRAENIQKHTTSTFQLVRNGHIFQIPTLKHPAFRRALDFACATLYVAAGDFPGAHRRAAPPQRPAGVLGAACEAPRRPTDEGTPLRG